MEWFGRANSESAKVWINSPDSYKNYKPMFVGLAIKQNKVISWLANQLENTWYLNTDFNLVNPKIDCTKNVWVLAGVT